MSLCKPTSLRCSLSALLLWIFGLLSLAHIAFMALQSSLHYAEKMAVSKFLSGREKIYKYRSDLLKSQCRKIDSRPKQGNVY